LVIFEILTVKLEAAAECTEFSKLEVWHVPKCPIGSDATGYHACTLYVFKLFCAPEKHFIKVQIQGGAKITGLVTFGFGI